MAGSGVPRFYNDLRFAVDDAGVEYRFDPAPSFDIVFHGKLRQAARSGWSVAAPARVLFGPRVVGQRITLKDGEISAWSQTTASDSREIVEIIRLAQMQTSQILIDIDLVSPALGNDPNQWDIADINIVLANIL